jgi:hypothetical protein
MGYSDGFIKIGTPAPSGVEIYRFSPTSGEKTSIHAITRTSIDAKERGVIPV